MRSPDLVDRRFHTTDGEPRGLRIPLLSAATRSGEGAPTQDVVLYNQLRIFQNPEIKQRPTVWETDGGIEVRPPQGIKDYKGTVELRTPLKDIAVGAGITLKMDLGRDVTLTLQNGRAKTEGDRFEISGGQVTIHGKSKQESAGEAVAQENGTNGGFTIAIENGIVGVNGDVFDIGGERVSVTGDPDQGLLPIRISQKRTVGEMTVNNTRILLPDPDANPKKYIHKLTLVGAENMIGDRSIEEGWDMTQSIFKRAPKAVRSSIRRTTQKARRGTVELLEKGIDMLWSPLAVADDETAVPQRVDLRLNVTARAIEETWEIITAYTEVKQGYVIVPLPVPETSRERRIRRRQGPPGPAVFVAPRVSDENADKIMALIEKYRAK